MCIFGRGSHTFRHLCMLLGALQSKSGQAIQRCLKVCEPLLKIHIFVNYSSTESFLGKTNDGTFTSHVTLLIITEWTMKCPWSKNKTTKLTKEPVQKYVNPMLIYTSKMYLHLRNSKYTPSKLCIFINIINLITHQDNSPVSAQQLHFLGKY